MGCVRALVGIFLIFAPLFIKKKWQKHLMPHETLIHLGFHLPSVKPSQTYSTHPIFFEIFFFHRLRYNSGNTHTISMKLFSKAGLLEMMRAGGEKQNEAIQSIWRKTEWKTRRIINKGRGLDEDWKDIRQEATMLLYQAITQGKFRGTTDAELVAFYSQTFLYVWMDRLRKRDRMPEADLGGNNISVDPSIEETLIQLEIETQSYQKLEECLQKLDEKGRQIVRWRYFEISSLSLGKNCPTPGIQSRTGSTKQRRKGHETPSHLHGCVTDVYQ